MINFILPQCHLNNQFNRLLKQYVHMYPERLNFSEKINIFAEQGNFSFSFWHGGINTNIEDRQVMLFPHVSRYSDQLEMPVIIDCSNIYLDLNKDWIKDSHIKMILSIFENQGNYIKVCNKNIQNQIEKYFPGYNFILKLNNQQEENNTYDFVEILNIIPEDIHKSKILYPLRSRCINCNNNCNEEENLYQFTFSELSAQNFCKKIYPNTQEVMEEYFKARKNGYTNFYFEEISSQNIGLFNRFLMEFFIKPEFHNSFQQEPLK